MTSDNMTALAQWAELSNDERAAVLRGLPQREAHDLLLSLSTHDQYQLLAAMPGLPPPVAAG